MSRRGVRRPSRGVAIMPPVQIRKRGLQSRPKSQNAVWREAAGQLAVQRSCLLAMLAPTDTRPLLSVHNAFLSLDLGPQAPRYQRSKRSADSDAPYLLERSAGAADFSCSTPEDTGERDGRLTGRPQARTGARIVLDSMGTPSLAVNADMATVLGFDTVFECLAESAESPLSI